MISIPLILIVLLAVDSLHFVFARLLLPHISPGVSVMYVLGIATVEVFIFGLATRRLSFQVLRPNVLFFAAIGFLVAASTNINYEAVAFIDPGTASLLAQTGTIFSLGLGVVWLKDRLNRPQLFGAALAVVGIFIMEFQAGEFARLGSLLVLVSTFMYALHSALTKRYAEDFEFLNFFFYRLLFTTGFLAIFASLRGAFAWPSSEAWPLLLLVGTTDVVLSRALYYLALRRLTLSLHTIALTLSPLVAVLWALALFGILPANQQLIGGIVVLTGVLAASLGRTKH